MNEEQIRKLLNPAFDDARNHHAPAFDKVWASAEARYHRSARRYKVLAGLAATIALLAITAVFWSAQNADLRDDYLIADAFMNSTSWLAPSDSLMPVHRFDIYREIPFLIESTNSMEGTLL